MKTPVWQHNDADICDGSKPAARSFLSVERSEVRHNADPKAVQQARPPANPEPVPGHVAASPPEVRDGPTRGSRHGRVSTLSSVLGSRRSGGSADARTRRR